ncbi:HAD family hydrolase [Candidatus Micrarchaeota archaeon]|nr:HAD family hydrolase [Candidatus Micrarchaeota archaeon]
MILAWDFDGVLVDTLHECHQSYNGALQELGLPGLTAEEFSFERKTAVQATDFFAQYFTRKSGDTNHTPEKTEKSFEQNRDVVLKLRDAYHRHRDAHLEADFDNNPVYPGVVKTLEKLRQESQRMAVVSARDDGSLKKYLRVKGLDGLFDKVVGSSSFFAKSHLLKPLQVDSLKEKNVWFVDDMPAVLFSLQDHVRLFYAQWGYGKLDEYMASAHPGAGKPKTSDVTTLKKPADILSYIQTRT